MRLTGRDKNYYKHQFELFAEKVLKDNSHFDCIVFGKTDIRGGFQIGAHLKDTCYSVFKYCESRDQLIGFVLGYNHCNKLH
jgi:hypothetical protein